MERITSHQVVDLMEAYNAVYAPQVNEDYLWESYLTEEFISEAYQTVADYLVYNGFVPGYNTAEVYMSEMTVEDIDAILFETGVLDEQYLMEAGFFQGIGAGADRFVSGAQRRVQGAVNTVVGGTQRAVNAGQRAVQGAKNAVVGGAQRAAGAVQRAVTPVAQAVKGTAQRAVAAGQSALGGAARAVQGAAQGAVRGATAAGQAVVGGAQRAVNAGQSALGGATRAVQGAVNSATRRIGQEIEISRKVGAGEPLNKPSGQSTGQFGRYGAPSSQVKTPAPAATRPAAPAATRPAAPTAGAKPTPSAAPAATTGNPPLRPPALPPITGRPSLASQNAELRAMQAASRQRQGLTQSFDPFDVVMGHLIDEGYADTEQAALQIMANMSEDWRESILDENLLDVARGVGKVAGNVAKDVKDRVTGKKELIGGPQGYVKVGGPSKPGDVKVSGIGPVGTYGKRTTPTGGNSPAATMSMRAR